MGWQLTSYRRKEVEMTISDQAALLRRKLMKEKHYAKDVKLNFFFFLSYLYGPLVSFSLLSLIFAMLKEQVGK